MGYAGLTERKEEVTKLCGDVDSFFDYLRDKFMVDIKFVKATISKTIGEVLSRLRNYYESIGYKVLFEGEAYLRSLPSLPGIKVVMYHLKPKEEVECCSIRNDFYIQLMCTPPYVLVIENPYYKEVYIFERKGE